MATYTNPVVETAAAFVRAFAAGDEAELRALTDPDLVYRQVNPGGFVEVLGVDALVEKVRREIADDGGWETLFVDAAPAADKARVHASVRFVRGGRRLRYDWTEYLELRDGRVWRRDLACGGARPDDGDAG